MHLSIKLIVVGFFFLFSAHANSADVVDLILKKDSRLNDLTKYKHCIKKAIRTYRLKPLAYLSILAQENGKVGQQVKNKNNTHDYGPAQINSSWVKRFKKFNININDELLRNHTCFNLFVSGWIQRYELDNAPDYWTGIGRYHSRTPHLQRSYIRKIYNIWRGMLKKIQR